MADPTVIEYPLVTRKNGSVRPEPPSDPLPDFTVHLPSIVGKNYSKIQTVPFTPDVLSVVQDPLLAKRGLRYVDDMMRDDMVTAGLSAIMATVLTVPRTVPADDTKEAKLDADWFAGMLDAIPGGILTKLYNIDLALPYGFSVQEKKEGLQTTEHSGRRGWQVLKDLLFRLPHFFEFPTDPETGALLCLRQRDTWGNVVADLPLEKAVYYVWDAWADPFRGRSILRPAYEHWYAKQQFIRFANEQGERVVGKLKITQTTEKWLHPDITFKEYAKKVFDNYHFSRGFVVLFGTTVEVVTNEADPQIFLNSIAEMNKAILRAIGVPWLAVEEGLRTGTYALGKVHQDGFLSKLQRLKSDIEELIRECIFRPLCRANGIPERLCPSVDMSPVLEEDKQQSVTLYLQAAAQVPGFAQPADVNWLRERIGVPEVDEQDAVEGAGNPVQDGAVEPGKVAKLFSEWPPRPLTPPEQRVDFSGISSALDGFVASDREALSRLWDEAVERLRREVLGWARSPSVSPAQILRKLDGMHLELDEFAARLKEGAVRAYEAGQAQAARELAAVGDPVARKFDAQVSPDDPLTPKNYEGLLEARAFAVARDMQAKVLSAIAQTLMNAFDTGATVSQSVAVLDTKFSALAAGQLISPGTPGYDFTQPAVQLVTVTTLYNSAMNGGRVDVYTQNQDFAKGIEWSSVLDTRTTRTCQACDGLKVPFSNPAYLKFSKARHYSCRGVAVPVTVVDMGADPVAYEWSSQSEIDQANAVQGSEFPGWA